MKYLSLKEKTSDLWLNRCSNIIYLKLCNIREIYINSETHESEVFTRDFIPEDLKSISPKFIKSVEEIFNFFGCVGIWKKSIIGNSIEPITIIRIYGYKEDVDYIYNILHYLLDGCNRYFRVHVDNLKRKEHVRRVMRKKLPNKVNARKRTNDNIKRKLRAIEWFIPNMTPIYDKKSLRIKKALIIKTITEVDKVDYKGFINMQEPTIKSMYSRRGKIQINRLI